MDTILAPGIYLANDSTKERKGADTIAPCAFRDSGGQFEAPYLTANCQAFIDRPSRRAKPDFVNMARPSDGSIERRTISGFKFLGPSVPT